MTIPGIDIICNYGHFNSNSFENFATILCIYVHYVAKEYSFFYDK